MVLDGMLEELDATHAASLRGTMSNLWNDMPDLTHLRHPPLKAIQAISHEGVEPDVYDDLEAEKRFALDVSKDPFCPAKSRERLREYAAKCSRLLLLCPTSAKP